MPIIVDGDKWLDQLDPEQMAAVTAPVDKPILVVSSAGSGKTTVLTTRVAWLLDQGVDPRGVVVTTFSRKAADELKERLVPMVGQLAADQLMVNTIHGLCLSILKEEGLAREVVMPSEQRRYLEDALSSKGANWDCGWKYPLYWIARMKLALVMPDRSEFALRSELRKVSKPGIAEDIARQIARVYRLYEQAMSLNGKMDFNDMLMWTAEGLRREDFRSRWQSRVDYVLVDELQDTSRLSSEILETLAAPENRLFGVGDRAQAIYQWNLADPEHNIVGFPTRLPGFVFKIQTNYRSTQTIVEIGNKVCSHLYDDAKFRKDLVARPDAPAGDAPETIVVDDVYQEAEWVADWIQQLEAKPCDVFVLYRLNAQSRAIEDELVRRGIPYIVQGSLGFYDRAVIKDVLALMQLVENPDNDDAFQRVSNIGSIWHSKHYHGFGHAFFRECLQHGKSMWQGMLQMRRDRGTKEFQRRGIEDEIELIEMLKEQGDHKPLKTISAARELAYDTWLRRKEGVPEGDEDTQAFDDLAELEEAARGFPTNAAMLEHVRHVREMKEQSKKELEIDCVVLSTVHRAKGLERPLVFGVGMVEGVLPHWRSDPSIFPDLHGRDELPVQNTSSIREERCAAYVLVTRAKSRVFLSAVREWRGRAVQPSRFIAEMGIELKIAQENKGDG